MNPIVSKALERLERARRPETPVAYYSEVEPEPAFPIESEPTAEFEEPPPPKPKLTVVAPPPAPVMEDPLMQALDVQLEIQESIREMRERKPIRMISDDDIALSYLETCLSLPALSGDTRDDIPGIGRRVMAGFCDLLLMALMVAPFGVGIQMSGGNWSDMRVVGTMAGITALIMFAYLTFSTAMTGRTLGMRMFSLRTIDLRTGLIPTGGQSIKRAIGFVFSFAFLGLGLAYALIDPDHRTAYDRLSNTIVVRV
jgi:uncharacterized RDD family membrane protein YckC